MLILYGGGEGRIVLGEVGRQKCPYCEETAEFATVLDYRFSHIFFFRLLRGRKYSLRCGHCGSLQPLDKKTVRDQYPEDPIPFMHKYGLLAAPVIGLFLFVLAHVVYYAVFGVPR